MSRSSSYQPDVMPARYPDGYMYVDGELINECTDIEANIEISTQETKVLSQRGTTVFQTKSVIKGKFSLNRATPQFQAIAYRMHKGEEVRFNILARADDEHSQYYRDFGAKQDLFLDCMLTGTINITKLSANEDGPINDEFEFTAREWVPNYC